MPLSNEELQQRKDYVEQQKRNAEHVIALKKEIVEWCDFKLKAITAELTAREVALNALNANLDVLANGDPADKGIEQLYADGTGCI